MQFNVAQLLKEHTGAVRRYALQESLDALGSEVKFLGPLVGELQLMRTTSGVLATGDFSTAIHVSCNRCLEPIVSPVRFHLEENFHPTTEVYTGRLLQPEEYEGDKDELSDTALVIDEHHILDLTEVLRQDILLAMPMYPSCNWTGSGECPNFTAHIRSLEGVRVITGGDESGRDDEIDPRWAALLALKDSVDDEAKRAAGTTEPQHRNKPKTPAISAQKRIVKRPK